MACECSFAVLVQPDRHGAGKIGNDALERIVTLQAAVVRAKQRTDRQRVENHFSKLIQVLTKMFLGQQPALCSGSEEHPSHSAALP